MNTCPQCDGPVIGRICMDCMFSPGEDAVVTLPDPSPASDFDPAYDAWAYDGAMA